MFSSLLDHLAWTASTNPRRPADVMFPIWRRSEAPTAEQWAGFVGARLPGAPPAFIAEVCALQPFPGGHDEWLWVLHDLDITDKHLITLGLAASYQVAVDTGAVMRAALANMPPEAGISQEWISSVRSRPTVMAFEHRYPLEIGDVLMPWNRAAQQEHQPTMRADIAFEHPEAVHGQLAVPTLIDLVSRVENLIDRLGKLVLPSGTE